MITIKDLKGNEAPITNISEISLNEKLYEVAQIDFTIYDFPENDIGFRMISERGIIILPENQQQYRISNRVEGNMGDIKYLQITALHVLHDLNDRYIKAPKREQKSKAAQDVKAIGTISNADGAVVYNSPVSAVATGRTLEHLSRWKIDQQIKVNSVVWYRVSTAEWIKAKDVSFTSDGDSEPPEIEDEQEDTSVTMTLDEFMAYITKDTKFSYSIHDQFDSYTFPDYPEGRALDLFLNTGRNAYGYEFTVDNYHIDIFKKIGKEDSFVFVDKGNIADLASSYDDLTITTHIEGESTYEDDSGQQITIYGEYTSPNADYYDRIDADYYAGSNARTESELIEELKKHIQDYPLIQITLEYHAFKDGLIDNLNDIKLGNSGWIRDRKDIDISSRIIETTHYLQSPENHEPTIVFGNVIGDLASTLAHLGAAADSSGNMGAALPSTASEAIKEFFGNSKWTEKDVKQYGRN